MRQKFTEIVLANGDRFIYDFIDDNENPICICPIVVNEGMWYALLVLEKENLKPIKSLVVKDLKGIFTLDEDGLFASEKFYYDHINTCYPSFPAFIFDYYHNLLISEYYYCTFPCFICDGILYKSADFVIKACYYSDEILTTNILFNCAEEEIAFSYLLAKDVALDEAVNILNKIRELVFDAKYI